MADYDDPGWGPAIAAVLGRLVMPWRAITRPELRGRARGILAATRLIFLPLVLSLFLILFVLSFIVVEPSRWAAPGGWGLATGTAGAIALLTLLWFRGRPLTATDEGTAVKAWRESLFVGI